jgi:16S rRNA G966 N2-methylase RsmD
LRVLITCPRLYIGGGATNYYNAIRDWFSIDVDFFEVEAFNEKETPLEKIGHLYSDTVGFWKMVKGGLESFDLIHLNPPFDYKTVARDGLLLRIAKKFGQRALVMFHGWHEKRYKNLCLCTLDR